MGMELNEIIQNLGPLAPLVGIWEGDKGEDRAPADDRGVENNKFRERMEFTPISQVKNHEQILYGLRYKTTAWEVGKEDPFHEEQGYWLWDPAAQQVMRCFMVPRGVALIAGATVNPKARSFTLTAKLGSLTYGILSNKFLDKQFQTVRYDLQLNFHPDHRFSYEEDTQLKIKGQRKIFHHVDKNTLRRVEPI